MRFSKPLKTDNTTIKAIVPIAIPEAEMAEIILMALCDFFENKYLRAILNEKDSSFNVINDFDCF
jgi:hypothetical protein